MHNQWAIGIDLGGTNTKVGLVESDGRVHSSQSRATEAVRGSGYFVAAVGEMVDELLKHAGGPRAALVGAGVGSPGPLDLKIGVILKAANLAGWVKVPLRERLAQALRTSVVLENDANAAAYGEYIAQVQPGGRLSGASLPGCRHMVLLTLGTGVGAGVIIDGEVLHGRFDNAGELGHMIVVPGGLPCPCGQRGCLEAYASAGALARRMEAALAAGEHSIVARGADAAAIAAAAQRGDALCLRIWDEACLYLAIACINIQHAYNPEVILLGGGMAGAREFLLDSVRAHFRAHQWHLHDDFPRIELARLGGDAGIVGAAMLAWAEVSKVSK